MNDEESRKLAVKSARYYYDDLDPNLYEIILTALQSVQRAEREKAEGLREALLNVIGLMDGAPEDVVGYIKQELAAYEASKDGVA